MLETLPETLRRAPELLKSAPDTLRRAPELLKSAPERLQARRDEAVANARHQVHLARGDAQERLWLFETDVLHRAEDLLTRGEELPVVKRVVPHAERLVHERLELTTRPPIADYDDLNVKQVSAALEGLSRVDLLRVRGYETAHKDRVTVTRAVDKALEQLKQRPAA